MDVEDRDCRECGASNWNFLLDEGYPDRRRERDQTVREVYVCESCGAEGRRFDQQDDGTVTFSAAMR